MRRCASARSRTSSASSRCATWSHNLPFDQGPPNCFLTVNLSPQQLCTPPVEEALSGGTLAPLPRPLAAEAEAMFISQPDLGIVVVIDDQEQPVGLLNRADALSGRPWRRGVQRVGPGTGIGELAVRCMTRPPINRFDPSVCCDGRGRYVGLVRMERIIERLAERSPGSSAPML